MVHVDQMAWPICEIEQSLGKIKLVRIHPNRVNGKCFHVRRSTLFSGKQMLLILHFKSALSNPSVQQRLCALELGHEENEKIKS